MHTVFVTLLGTDNVAWPFKIHTPGGIESELTEAIAPPLMEKLFVLIVVAPTIVYPN
jgi:hypothetical protein